jgi:hypothetical protein
MKTVSTLLLLLSLFSLLSAPVSARQSRFFAVKRVDADTTEGSGEGEGSSESESSLSFTDGRACCTGDVSIVLGEYEVEPDSEESEGSNDDVDDGSDADETEASVADGDEAKRMFVHLQDALASGRAHRLPKREEGELAEVDYYEEDTDGDGEGEGEGESESESESESSMSDSATFSGKSEARRLVRAVKGDEDEAFLNEGLCIKKEGDVYTLCGTVDEAAAVEEGGGVAALLSESDALLADEGLQIREASSANVMTVTSVALLAVVARL